MDGDRRGRIEREAKPARKDREYVMHRKRPPCVAGGTNLSKARGRVGFEVTTKRATTWTVLHPSDHEFSGPSCRSLVIHRWNDLCVFLAKI